MKKSFTIHILHRPTNTMLCADGVFRGFLSCCGSKDDTLMYRSVNHALRRLNTIRKDMLDDCVLEVIEICPDDPKVYHLDRFGKEVDGGPHAGNTSEYVRA